MEQRRTIMRLRAKVKAGDMGSNHNETNVQDRRGLRGKTHVKAGGMANNHNEAPAGAHTTTISKSQVTHPHPGPRQSGGLTCQLLVPLISIPVPCVARSRISTVAWRPNPQPSSIFTADSPRR